MSESVTLAGGRWFFFSAAVPAFFEPIMRIDVYHHFDSRTDSALAQLLEGLHRLESQLMNQNESISALKTAFDAFKRDVNASLDNIAADEAAIQAKLATLGNLTPANQAIVDSLVADMGTLAAKTKAIADSIPDAAPPVEP